MAQPAKSGKGGVDMTQASSCIHILHAPPFACHPAHTAPKRDDACVEHKRWGCRSCTRDVCGVVLRCSAGGAPLQLHALRLQPWPWVLHSPIGRAGGQVEGGGISAWAPHAKGGRGACRAACVSRPCRDVELGMSFKVICGQGKGQ